jgi:hypothetical protein
LNKKSAAPKSSLERLRASIAYLIDHEDSGIAFTPEERDLLAEFLAAKLDATYKMEAR